MDVSLAYGNHKHCILNLRDSQHINIPADPDTWVSVAIDDAIHKVLNSPIEFPALRDIIFAGDSVAIAVEPDIPQCGDILFGLLTYIRENTGLSAGDITIVYGGSDWQFNALQLPSRLNHIFDTEIQFEIHDANQSEQLAFLATATDSEPLRFNKTLVDADVVLPLSIHLPSTLTYHLGFYHCLFPTFADQQTQIRISKQSSTATDQDAIAAASMLGTQFMMKVTPGFGDQIVNFSAGEIRALDAQLATTNTAQHYPAWNPAELSIGTLSGHTSGHNWDAISRGLETLADVTQEGGMLILCTEVTEDVPPILSWLKSTDRDDEIESQLHQAMDPDTQIAQTILRLREAFRICLLSQLDGEVIESLGMAPIQSTQQIQKLADGCESINCIIDAHRVTFHQI